MPVSKQSIPEVEPAAIPEAEPEAVLQRPPVIVDFGQKSRRKISGLKRGEGPLFDALCETVDLLEADGVISKDVQVVVAVVEKMPEGMAFPTLRWY